MHVYRLNAPLFELDMRHPARRFLEAFIECRRYCVGKELHGVDQEWWSPSTNRTQTFSSFAYEHLSFDIQLDGWLSDSPSATASERRVLETIPGIRSLMTECQQAAIDEGNDMVIEMVDRVLHMLELWERCIDARLQGKQETGG
jgi:hypothetical protein